jgi:hypothetical protein
MTLHHLNHVVRWTPTPAASRRDRTYSSSLLCTLTTEFWVHGCMEGRDTPPDDSFAIVVTPRSHVRYHRQIWLTMLETRPLIHLLMAILIPTPHLPAHGACAELRMHDPMCTLLTSDCSTTCGRGACTGRSWHAPHSAAQWPRVWWLCCACL